MGILDKAKESANKLAERAQEVAEKGQDKVDKYQERKEIDNRLRRLGILAFEDLTERSSPRSKAEIEQIKVWLMAKESEGATVVPQPGAESFEPPPADPRPDDAPDVAPPPEPPASSSP